VNAKPRTARRAGLTVTLIGAALVTSACANGQEAQTAQEKPTLDGTNTTAGNMVLRGLVIESPPTGKYSSGDDPLLRVVIVNKSGSADTLTGISGSAFSSWGSFASTDEANAFIAGQQRGAGGASSSASGTTASSAPTTTAPLPLGEQKVPIAPGTSYASGQASSPGVLLLEDLKLSSLYPAQSVTLKFTFDKSGSVSVRVPVALSSTPGSETVPPQGSVSPSPASP
jgi:hypothetical protein